MNLGLQSRGCTASRTMEELTHTDTLWATSSRVGPRAPKGFFLGAVSDDDRHLRDRSLLRDALNRHNWAW
jgi:hypothetical protein